jgi:hypothetical protein
MIRNVSRTDANARRVLGVVLHVSSLERTPK